MIKNLCVKLDAIEYYLLDASGSMLFLDATGNTTWLNVKHELELLDYIGILKDSAGDKSLIEAITNHKKIPFLFSEEDYKQPISHWKNFMYEAQPLPGAAGYFYSLIPGEMGKNLKREKIISYKDYCRAIQA